MHQPEALALQRGNLQLDARRDRRGSDERLPAGC
jgi:hypothetical protein